MLIEQEKAPPLIDAHESSSTISDTKPYRNGNIRFVQLALLAMVVFGIQYAFNNPQALQSAFQQNLSINQTQFNLFYTLDAFPNIFSCFFIGFLIDSMGVRISIVVLSIAVVVFQTLIAVGGYLKSYQIILVGRSLFGIASESAITAQACLVTIWFTGNQLAFALGISITFPELGNALNSSLSPMIFRQTQSLGTPLMVSVAICTISACCAGLAAYLDLKAEKEDQSNELSLISDSGLPLEANPQVIKCSDVGKLRKQFWLLITLCAFGMGLYIPFMDNVNRMFMQRFCFTQVEAGQYITVTYISAAIISPLLGYIVDKVGYRRYFIIAGMGIYTLAQLIIVIWPTCLDSVKQTGPIVGLFFIGLGYCFYANCIVPSIPLVVRRKVLGISFGIMKMAQSISQAFLPLVSGYLVGSEQDPALGYRYSELMFTGLSIAGLLVSLILLFLKDRYKKRLDTKSGWQKLGQGSFSFIDTNSMGSLTHKQSGLSQTPSDILIKGSYECTRRDSAIQNDYVDIRQPLISKTKSFTLEL